ncbi:hypothetical protein Dda3937_04370 [Dickeya dadantii 3937]|uniref:Uncharacterized protein n=1 Tax=Dickeya dadantii (strain 3937) TaxID=198628 RepID=E0SMB3_DICD3|nr:hypothetical protein Dda3937_04370 [Dickeya dadantii 3937]
MCCQWPLYRKLPGWLDRFGLDGVFQCRQYVVGDIPLSIHVDQFPESYSEHVAQYSVNDIQQAAYALSVVLSCVIHQAEITYLSPINGRIERYFMCWIKIIDTRH